MRQAAREKDVLESLFFTDKKAKKIVLDKNYFLQNYLSKFHQTWKRESGFQERKCFTKSKQGTKDGFSSSQLSSTAS